MTSKTEGGAAAWAVLDMSGEGIHSVHISKEQAERAAKFLGTAVPLYEKNGVNDSLLAALNMCLDKMSDWNQDGPTITQIKKAIYEAESFQNEQAQRNIR